MIKIEKLYKAKSIVKNFKVPKIKGLRKVTLYWYYADKQWANSNYNSIIKGYDDMSPEDKRKAEEVINEYFTLDEIEFIRPYLKGKLKNIKVEEVSLPMDVKYHDKKDNEVRIYYSLSHLAYGCNTICLDKEKDYDLPFKVWGYIYPNMNTYRETSKGRVPVLDGYLDGLDNKKMKKIIIK